MTRRGFLLHAASGAAPAFRLPLAHGANYGGKLFAFVQADGGWDPTSFCDPKTNLPGEAVINHWATRAGILQAGSIPYAPYASNEAFFEKYSRRTLVVNGVDAQTNSHSVGIVHNWSGRLSEGYPTTTALIAAHYGGAMTMPYLSFGGFSNPAGLTVYTRLDNAALVREIGAPDLPPSSTGLPQIARADLEALHAARSAAAERLAAVPNLLPRAARNRDLFAAAVAREATEGLREFAAIIPATDQLQAVEGRGHLWISLKRQCQLAVLAFKSGAAVSADLHLGGFDTHRDHDADHAWLMGNLTESVDYLWNYAEMHGVARTACWS